MLQGDSPCSKPTCAAVTGFTARDGASLVASADYLFRRCGGGFTRYFGDWSIRTTGRSFGWCICHPLSSYCIDHYGKNVFSLTSINLDGFAQLKCKFMNHIFQIMSWVLPILKLSGQDQHKIRFHFHWQPGKDPHNEKFFYLSRYISLF